MTTETTTKRYSKEDLLRKIQKLLNLATENGGNENQAQQAMLNAQRLMIENDISEDDVKGAVVEQVKKEVGRVYTTPMKNQYYHKMMAPIIAKNFRSLYYYQMVGGKSQIVFMGLKGDIELAKAMYEFAISALEYNADMYIKEVRQTRYIRNAIPIKTDYVRGFIKGVYEKFKEQVKEQSMALVLVVDALVVAEHDKMKFRKSAGSTGGQGGAGDTEAYASGVKAGKSLSKASGHLE